MSEKDMKEKVNEAMKRLDSLGIASDIPMIAAACGLSFDEVKMVLAESFAIK